MIDTDSFDMYIEKQNLADESLISFLKDTNYAEKNLESYQLYLKNSANSMTFFQKAVKKTGTVLKSLGGTLASMAIMWAASELISLAVKGIDTLIYKSENAIKAAEEAQDAIKSIKSDLDSMNKTIEDPATKFAELSNGVDTIVGSLQNLVQVEKGLKR